VTKLGIMQGRLVPPEDGRIQCFPRERWQSEFAHAKEVPFDYIEWIYDLYGREGNPLRTPAGVQKLKEFTGTSGVRIRSVCADYFMDRPLLRCSAAELAERLQELRSVMQNARAVGVNRVVLPFVDASAIRDEKDFAAVRDALRAAMPIADEAGVEIHLETSLSPAEFAKLLEQVGHPMLKVNYDSGNSASLGYDVADEFAAYGSAIGSVHIKDRVRGGTTVPLGSGNADFRALFACLEKVGYSGDFTLQVARGTPGDEVAWAKKNVAWVRSYWPN
jgi:L-ribulose-5-phosphate 3-epimerase